MKDKFIDCIDNIVSKNRSAQNNEFKSLDLNAVFDIANIDLLLKRMRTIGLPDDLVGLVEAWLKDRCLFNSCDISC